MRQVRLSGAGRRGGTCRRRTGRRRSSWASGSTQGYRLICQLWIPHDIELVQDDRRSKEESERCNMNTPAPTSYVILTDKPGLFHTEIGADMRALERYDYVFHGRTRAHFVIAALERETRIAIVDDGQPRTVSQVPSKLLKKYASLTEARRDLDQLINSRASRRPAPARRNLSRHAADHLHHERRQGRHGTRRQQPAARVAARTRRHSVQVRRRTMRDLQMPDRIRAGAHRCSQTEGAKALERRRSGARLSDGLPNLHQR